MAKKFDIQHVDIIPLWRRHFISRATPCFVPSTLRRCAPEIQRGGSAFSGLRIDSHSTCALQPQTQQSIADRHERWSPSREYTLLFYAYYLFFLQTAHTNSFMIWRHLVCSSSFLLINHDQEITWTIPRVGCPSGIQEQSWTLVPTNLV